MQRNHAASRLYAQFKSTSTSTSTSRPPPVVPISDGKREEYLIPGYAFSDAHDSNPLQDPDVGRPPKSPAQMAEWRRSYKRREKLEGFKPQNNAPLPFVPGTYFGFLETDSRALALSQAQTAAKTTSEPEPMNLLPSYLAPSLAPLKHGSYQPKPTTDVAHDFAHDAYIDNPMRDTNILKPRDNENAPLQKGAPKPGDPAAEEPEPVYVLPISPTRTDIADDTLVPQKFFYDTKN